MMKITFRDCGGDDNTKIWKLWKSPSNTVEIVWGQVHTHQLSVEAQPWLKLHWKEKFQNITQDVGIFMIWWSWRLLFVFNPFKLFVLFWFIEYVCYILRWRVEQDQYEILALSPQNMDKAPPSFAACVRLIKIKYSAATGFWKSFSLKAFLKVYE